MGLSLEIKKFINSKHTGDYVEVTLPGELPARKSEIKAVNRDSSAVESAQRKMKELNQAKLNAEKAYRAASDAVTKLRSDSENARRELDKSEKNKSEVEPDFNKAKEKFDSAKADYALKKTEYNNASAAVRSAEDEKKRAEQILKAATAASEAPSAEQKLRLEDEVKAASERLSEKRELFDAVKARLSVVETEYKSIRSEFDSANEKMKLASASLQSANTACNVLEEKLKKLTERQRSAKERLEKLTADITSAETDVVKLKKNARSIVTKYETARFHYMEIGKGEPMILVHSAGQSLYTFNKVFEKLARSYRVILLDIAGHGYSQRPDFFDFSIEDHGESLARFMDALGIETAHFVGYSMGAGYVISLAKLHPERVDKIVLISPGGITSDMPLPVRMLESGFLGVLAGRVFSQKSVASLLDECVFDHTAIKEHDIEQYSMPFMSSDVRYSVRRTVNAFDEEEVLPLLRDINHEVLVLWGDEDRWHPLERKDIYLAVLQNSRFELVRNSGHLPHEERPDRVCELIREFIPAGYETDL